MNLHFVGKAKLSPFRKIAIGTWRSAFDPTVYGTLEVRMERALEYMAAFRKRHGKRITVTHLIAKAVAAAFERTPEANAVLRFGRLYVRRGVGVFFQVAIIEGDQEPDIDLSGFVLHDVDKKSLVDICDEFRTKLELVRARKDADLERTRRVMRRIPAFLLPWALRISSFFAYTVNVDMSAFGVPKDAFGSVMITNIGSLGLDVAYAPLVHYARLPLLVALGAVRDVPVVEGGAVIAGKAMKVNVTFDHRFLDGAHAANMANVVRACMEQPFEHFDSVEPVGPQ